MQDCSGCCPATQSRGSTQKRTGALAPGVPRTHPVAAGNGCALARGGDSTGLARAKRAPTDRLQLLTHRRTSQRPNPACLPGVAGTAPSVRPQTVSAQLRGRALADPACASAGRRSCGCLPDAPAALAETDDGFHFQTFGDPGPPCPRTQANISSLLAATWEEDRRLLEKELRSDRELCRP